ncbi:MAG: hypothetical protein ACREH8_23595 [Opitutaceae bacterium]
MVDVLSLVVADIVTIVAAGRTARRTGAALLSRRDVERIAGQRNVRVPIVVAVAPAVAKLIVTEELVPADPLRRPACIVNCLSVALASPAGISKDFFGASAANASGVGNAINPANSAPKNARENARPALARLG